jgi:metallo-beta-lactamase family protein
VLGSVITLIEVTEAGVTKTLAFSGDLGRKYLPILKSPEFIKENVQDLILECTYGDRFHLPIADLAGELSKIINKAVEQKSKIIVPAFSLERTQELIYVIHHLANEKSIPALPIYVDSPLANNITQVFSQYPEYYDKEAWKDFGEINESPFFSENIIYTKSTEESKSLNNKKGPLIIIAGSGMAEGGRILHHLKNNISDSNNIILITGFQAQNTLGRRILDGISPIKIFGESYPVRAKVLALNELSAHADQKDLIDYIGQTNGLKNLFLVHTESPQAQAFEILVVQKYPFLIVNIPIMGQSFDL